MALLLKSGSEVRAHLTDSIAGSVTNTGMGILREGNDRLDDLGNERLHRSLATLSYRGETHETSVTLLPVS